MGITVLFVCGLAGSRSVAGIDVDDGAFAPASVGCVPSKPGSTRNGSMESATTAGVCAILPMGLSIGSSGTTVLDFAVAVAGGNASLARFPTGSIAAGDAFSCSCDERARAVTGGMTPAGDAPVSAVAASGDARRTSACAAGADTD